MTGPAKPDYDRLRQEVEAGAYPFAAEDEGELFARAVWLEVRLEQAEAALRELVRTSIRRLNPTLAMQADWEKAERDARAVLSAGESE